MSKLTDRASYLRGLAEGMKLNTEKDANKLLLQLLDLTADLTTALAELTEAHDDLADYVEMVDDALGDVEDLVYEDEEDLPPSRHRPGDEWDDEDLFDEDEDEEDGEGEGEGEDGDDVSMSITYACPHCGELVQFDTADVDFEEELPCPRCGKPLFPEFPVEEGEEEGLTEAAEEAAKEALDAEENGQEAGDVLPPEEEE